MQSDSLAVLDNFGPPDMGPRRDEVHFLAHFMAPEPIVLARFNISTPAAPAASFVPVVPWTFFERGLNGVGKPFSWKAAEKNLSVARNQLPGDIVWAIADLYSDRGMVVLEPLTGMTNAAELRKIRDVVLPDDLTDSWHDYHAKVAAHLAGVAADKRQPKLVRDVAELLMESNRKAAHFKESWLRKVNEEAVTSAGRNTISALEEVWRRQVGVKLSDDLRLANALPSDAGPASGLAAAMDVATVTAAVMSAVGEKIEAAKTEGQKETLAFINEVLGTKGINLASLIEEHAKKKKG